MTEPAIEPAIESATEPTIEPPDDRFALVSKRQLQRGKASWYGGKFHGRKTASGERFNMNDLTAAHKTLPFGTLLRVRVAATGREAVVRINDRGPYAHGRVIDLSRGAALALGLLDGGVAEVILLEAEQTVVLRP